MIDIGSIWPSNSPLDNAIGQVRKMNGKLHFLYWLEEIEFSDG